MKRFASLTSRLVATTVLLVAVVALLIASAATLALHSYLTNRLDRDVQASLGQAVQQVEHGAPLGGPGDGDADNRPFDGPRIDLLIGVSASGTASAAIRTEDDGFKAVDASTADALAAVPPDGN